MEEKTQSIFIVLGHDCESGKIDESLLFVYSENENGHTTTLKILDIHTFEVRAVLFDRLRYSFYSKSFSQP